MSPEKLEYLGMLVGVPRASGDEPAEVAQEIKDDMCSPRERG